MYVFIGKGKSMGACLIMINFVMLNLHHNECFFPIHNFYQIVGD